MLARVCTPSSLIIERERKEREGVRERERERKREREIKREGGRERKRERERERKREKERVFISKRNDGCLGTF